MSIWAIDSPNLQQPFLWVLRTESSHCRCPAGCQVTRRSYNLLSFVNGVWQLSKNCTLMRGNRRSRRRTVGLCFLTRFTACTPSPASTTTSIEGCDSSSVLWPSRSPLSHDFCAEDAREAIRNSTHIEDIEILRLGGAVAFIATKFLSCPVERILFRSGSLIKNQGFLLPSAALVGITRAALLQRE